MKGSTLATRFIIVRHGETLWNTQEREMGQLDSPLTERGLAQAHALAARLKGEPFSAVYSSDLPRASRTAEIIANPKRMDVTLDPRLRERHMGIFQGLTIPEMRERHPVERAEHEKNGFTFVIPRGESAKQRLDRTVSCLDEIGERHAGEVVLCVTHGGILMGFLQYVLGMDPTSGRLFKRPNAAVNIFEYSDGEWVLETWGDTSHLETLGALDDPHGQDRG